MVAHGLKFGKSATVWLPRKGFAKPRFNAERVIARLFALDFPQGAPEVVGAEWWFQARAPADPIGCGPAAWEAGRARGVRGR